MTTSSEPLALLSRAADLRAHGTPWNDTARQLAVEADPLHRLVAEHRRDYDRLARRARTEAARETFDAALAALRGLLKSEDPRVSLLAATTIVRYEMARMRRGERTARERLERDAQRVHRADRALPPLEPNVSESANVPKLQDVAAAKNGAQMVAPRPPASKPAVVLDEAARRRERLLTAAVMNPFAPSATARHDPKHSSERLLVSFLGE